MMDYWGKGIGSEMLRAVIQWAPNAGIERLELTVGKHNVLEDECMMGLLLPPCE